MINNVSALDSEVSGTQDSAQLARDLLQNSGSLKASRSSPVREKKKKDWDSRHSLLYSAVNHKMQKNVRAYFDRPREIEAFGLKHRPTLRTIWQLDTPERPPSSGEAPQGSLGKTWQPGGSCCGGGGRAAAKLVTEAAHLTIGGNTEKRLEVLAEVAGTVQEADDSILTQRKAFRSQAMKAPSTNYEEYEPHIDGGGWFLHARTRKWKYHPGIGVFQDVNSGYYYVPKDGMLHKVEEATVALPALAKSSSAPHLLRELDWDKRHSTMFNKDNHTYHPNFREYFERPRRLLY